MPSPMISLKLNETQQAIADEALKSCPAPRSMRNLAEVLARQNLPLEIVKQKIGKLCRDMNVMDPAPGVPIGRRVSEQELKA